MNIDNIEKLVWPMIAIALLFLVFTFAVFLGVFTAFQIGLCVGAVG